MKHAHHEASLTAAPRSISALLFAKSKKWFYMVRFYWCKYKRWQFLLQISTRLSFCLMSFVLSLMKLRASLKSKLFLHRPAPFCKPSWIKEQAVQFYAELRSMYRTVLLFSEGLVGQWRGCGGAQPVVSSVSGGGSRVSAISDSSSSSSENDGLRKASNWKGKRETLYNNGNAVIRNRLKCSGSQTGPGVPPHQPHHYHSAHFCGFQLIRELSSCSWVEVYTLKLCNTFPFKIFPFVILHRTY